MRRPLTLVGTGAAGLLLAAGLASSASAQNACLHFLPQVDYFPPTALHRVYLFRALPTDFNNDGHLDVVTVAEELVTQSSQFRTRISLRTGDGAGSLSAPLSLHDEAAPQSFRWVECADFTGDGRADILALSFSTGALVLIETDGSGTILPPRPVGFTTPQRISLAVGDLDGDGDLDLVATGFSQTVGAHVMWNGGSGQFSSGPLLAHASVNGSTPSSIFFSTVGDIDGDGDLDVVTPGYFAESQPRHSTNRIHIARNNGDGSFIEEVGEPLFQDESALTRPAVICPALLDLDGDADLDLVVSMLAGTGGRIGTWPNDGAGGFSLESQTATAAAAWHLTTGDFDGDGRMEIAWGSTTGGTFSGVEVLRNLAGGGSMPNFVAVAQPVIVPFARTVSVADMDGSGTLDLVCPDIESGRVTITLNITPQGVPCFPDVDSDYRVDSNDLGFLLNQWSRARGPADVVVDQSVNYRDLALILGFWGESIAPAGWRATGPAARPEAPVAQGEGDALRQRFAESADVDGDGVVTNDEFARAAAMWPQR